MAAAKKHTLEMIADDMGKGFNQDKLHTALLLSFAQSVFGVMRRIVTPSPLYRITYDEANNTVTLDENMGLSLPHQDGSLDITVEEEIFCCNIRDIPLLLEGETGVGKTFAAMKYLTTLFNKDQFFSYRLSSNAFVNNLFTHFQEGKVIDGMPAITAKVDKIATTAAGIVDEINRGDSNESLQLLDNEMHLGGVIYKLGIPIPEIGKDGKVNPDSGKLKKLLLVCAQNPSGSEDVKFTQTAELDAAVDNRLLKTGVGNAAPSAGTTLWLGEGCPNPHKVFFEDFAARSSKYLGIKQEAMANLKDDWLSVYAWITEAGKTDKEILMSAMELSDIMIATFSGDPRNYYAYERKVIEEWNTILGRSIKIKDSLKETEKVKQLNAVIQSFKVPIIFRDIVQIKKIADVLATLKNVTDALRETDPITTYQNMERNVTVREVAGAMALLTRNKQMRNAESPIGAINAVLTQYVTLVEDYLTTSKAAVKSFDIYNRDVSIKKIAIDRSIKETISGGGGIDMLIEKISEQAGILAAKVTVSEDIKNIIIARSVGDLMTLCGFLNQYRGEINPMLAGYNKKTQLRDVYQDLGRFYYNKLRETALVMPEIYQHRIQRTLGI